MSFLNDIRKRFRRHRHHQSPLQNISTTNPSFLTSSNVPNKTSIDNGVGIGSLTEDLTSDQPSYPDIGITQNSTSSSYPSNLPQPLTSTSTSISTTATMTRRRGRPPSPYPPSMNSFQTPRRSLSVDANLNPSHTTRHNRGSAGVSLRSQLEDASYPPLNLLPAPSTSDHSPKLGKRRSPWIQKAVAKVGKLKRVSQNAVSDKARNAANIFGRKQSKNDKDKPQQQRRQQQHHHHHQGGEHQPYQNSSACSSEISISLDESDIDDLDLRYFYDPCSEDPVNRMVFIAGPEHFYHLASQLETSPLEEFQHYAKELFIRSAGLGYAPAQFRLGVCYELGLTHFPSDPSQSFVWYKRAALQGHADAELAVSGWYLTGHPHGIAQSEPLAYEWAAKAALRGWPKAEYTLGHYHEVGIGVQQDLAEAKKWYIKAAAKGNERALLRLIVGHVGMEVDYAQLKDALLIENQNNPYLVHQLAQFYEQRDYGLIPDAEDAIGLYRASAQRNYAPAQYRLGACHEFGILEVQHDPKLAVEWYSQGAENGHVEALLALAGFYLDGSAGHAAEQSDEEAFRHVKAAAQRGVPKAEYITGFFLEHGLGVDQDPKEAKHWYRLACAKGVDTAEYRLRKLEKGKLSATLSN